MDPLAEQDRRLDSWKEIAAFFDRDERTVKRWEKERALPVHRVPGAPRGGVFAYTAELAQWLKGSPAREPVASRTQPHGLDDVASSGRTPGSAIAVVELQKDAGPAERQPAPALYSQQPSPRSRSGMVVPIVAALLAIAIVAVGVRLGAPRTRARPSAPVEEPPSSPSNAEAQELYLKGRYFWTKRTPDDLNRAVDYFTSAIVRDPNYAPAYVGLADCYNLLREFSVMPGAEAFPRALAAARKAVALDDRSAEAHNSLAFATFYGDWDAATAEHEFKRAIELNSNYVAAHHWYATFLLAVNRPREALAQIEQARKLEPSSAPILADKGAILYSDGQREQAFALLKQLESSEPAFLSPHSYLANIYFAERNYRKFVPEAKQAALLLRDKHALSVATAAEKGLASGGERRMLERMFDVRQKLYARELSPAYPLAQLCARLHRNQDSLNYLSDSFAKREIPMLSSPEDPSLSDLRGDPAFDELMHKVEHLR